MLHRIRRHLRVLAAAVLVSVSALGAWSSTVHELDCHDAECLPAIVAHDASAHAFRAPPPPDADRELHCVLCHWTRAVGPGAQPVSSLPFVTARLITAVQPPLRAPPAASPLHLA
jgi:hypothetical protein